MKEAGWPQDPVVVGGWGSGFDLDDAPTNFNDAERLNFQSAFDDEERRLMALLRSARSHSGLPSVFHMGDEIGSMSAPWRDQFERAGAFLRAGLLQRCRMGCRR